MKNIQLGWVVIALVFLATACKDKMIRKYKVNAPVYTSYEEFREMTEFQSPRSIKSKGNIYIKDQFLFIIEPEQGIHFIDNSTPESPENIGFLYVPGCTGMEIINNALFVNSFIDLVVFDITSIYNPTEISRVEDAFPDALPAIKDNKYPVDVIDKDEGVVTAWEVKQTKEEVNNYQTNWVNCPGCQTMTFESQFTSTDAALGSSSGSSNQGISGSITKFTLVNDYLYVMNQRRLQPFKVSNPESPVSYEGIFVSREVETLFAYNQHIFMGTTTGMLIYNTVTPDEPMYVSEVNHLTACDPVVVQGDYAFVTVRSGRTCGGTLNQLDIINIANYSSPFIEASYPMTNPHGLGIDGELLFICDGADGLKVFDASDPVTSGDHLLHTYNEVSAIDIIPFNELAIVIGETSLRQYKYNGTNEMELLSTIPIIQYP